MSHRIALGLALTLSLAVLPLRSAIPCTNFLITKGASADGSTMITYSADSHELYGELYFWPEKRHRPGAKRTIIEWDTGKNLGEIPEAAKTYRVIGNMNEHQLAIGETTYGGRSELVNPEGGMDYGSLIYVTLQRAKTAREAIKTMGDLVAEHGYCSHGESFSIADPNEAWIMEMIGMGEGRKGAVWVARRIPDGYISAHANQARIRQFPQDDPESCVYSENVISFAREKGYFDGRDEDFSFADTYAPLDYGGLRFCEARVWSMFRRAAPSAKLSPDFAMGKVGARPMPLWIRPDQKLAVSDVMAFMRDHFQDSPMDLHKGVGAGPFGLPYRWRPLVWELHGRSYFNERATSTQQTGFSFVTQSRASLPNPVGGVLWFGVDDTASTVYVPMYMGMTKMPRSFAQGTASFTEFSWDSAFWVFNHVANFAYTRYQDIIRDVQKVQNELESGFLRDQPEIEREALARYKRSPALAERYLTEYSVKAAETTTDRWRKLGQELMVKYLDGNVRDEQGKITHPPYPDEWYERIVAESGDHYLMHDVTGDATGTVIWAPPSEDDHGEEGDEAEDDAPLGWWEEGPSAPPGPHRLPCFPCERDRHGVVR